MKVALAVAPALDSISCKCTARDLYGKSYQDLKSISLDSQLIQQLFIASSDSSAKFLYDLADEVCHTFRDMVFGLHGISI